MAQGHEFRVENLHGSEVEELLGVVSGDDDLVPALVLLKPVGCAWQKFFVELGGASWDECPDLDPDEMRADEAYRCVDYAARFGLRTARVEAILCEVAAPGGGSHIKVHLSSGVFTLAPVDPADIESNAVVRFASR